MYPMSRSKSMHPAHSFFASSWPSLPHTWRHFFYPTLFHYFLLNSLSLCSEFFPSAASSAPATPLLLIQIHPQFHSHAFPFFLLLFHSVSLHPFTPTSSSPWLHSPPVVALTLTTTPIALPLNTVLISCSMPIIR